MQIQIKNALISVFDKAGIKDIAEELSRLKVNIYSTRGTSQYLKNFGIDAMEIEKLSNFPEILDGRVKTLHPKIFGGLLAKKDNENHQNELDKYKIPLFDLLIVDLYPFEKTVKEQQSENDIIEMIDIGGVALIRAAAKNFKYVVSVANKEEYSKLKNILLENKGITTLEDRKYFATKAFNDVYNYDKEIMEYFNKL